MTDVLDILVVDDNALDRELVRRLLPPGHPVHEAATAKAAIAEFDRARPSLVLLDNRLPDADGIDVLPFFAEHLVPVVMLTEVESPEVIVVAMQRGAEDYLVKGSLTRDSLARALHNAVEKSALRRQLHEQHTALAAQADTLEVRNREIRALATALSIAEQAERRRIAALLHDDLQQLLVGARFHLEVLRSAGPEERPGIADSTERILDQAIRSTRNLVAELTPPAAGDDLEAALRGLADHMGQLHRVTVHLTADTSGRLASRDLRMLVVQIVRELVFNAIKHAGVSEVRVRLSESDGGVAVAVEDDGCGFDPEEVDQRPTRGFGLHSVRERLELIGGGFEIASCPERGTSVTVTVPH